MKILVTLFAAAALAASATAQIIITQWNFNGVPMPGGTTSPMPSTGAGMATPIGGTTGASAAGSALDTGTGNNRWNITTFPGQGSMSGTAGARFLTSTVGFSDIAVSLQWRTSNTASRYSRMQYTLDGGTTWTGFGGSTIGAQSNVLTSGGGDTWNSLSFDLSSVTSASNNASFGIRLVSIFSPLAFTDGTGARSPNTAYQRADATLANYGTAGTYGLDLVTISGIPEPSTYAALAGALALAVAAWRRRRV